MHDATRFIRTCALCLAATFIAMSAALADPASSLNYAVRKTLPVGGGGRWDYAYFDLDPSADPKTAKVDAVDLGGKPEFLAADGKVLSEMPIGQGNDACGFDPSTGHAFASQGDGTLAVAGETTPGTFAIVQTVKTPPGARTLALDPSTHTLYLPTAEFEPAKPGERRPRPKPGSFMIVVVGPADAK